MCGGREGNLGLEQAGGLQAAILMGDLLGDPAKTMGNLFKPCKSKERRVTERWVFCGRRGKEILWRQSVQSEKHPGHPVSV